MSLLLLHVGRTIGENSRNLREHSLLIPWFSMGVGWGGGGEKEEDFREPWFPGRTEKSSDLSRR